MLAKVLSGGVTGIDGYIVEVEVDLSLGMPGFATVGLPDNAVKESKDRVKAALKNMGFQYPAKRITVNLAPADIRKEGSLYDLPMALGILASSAQLSPEWSGSSPGPGPEEPPEERRRSPGPRRERRRHRSAHPGRFRPAGATVGSPYGPTCNPGPDPAR